LTTIDPAGTPKARLEADFLAGLGDADYEARLLSICWLGKLVRLSPSAVSRLRQMLLKADELERLYLWEALFASHEYSELPSAAAEVLYLAPRSREFFLPRDRIGFMKFRVYETICSIPDPAVIPYMRKLAESPDPRSCYDALQSLRTQHDRCSAPIFLNALGDREQRGDNAFVAMHSLYELAGIGPGWEQIPTPDDFQHDGVAASEIRDWWKTVGEAEAKSVRSNICADSQR
jgi:hypothetical protein